MDEPGKAEPQRRQLPWEPAVAVPLPEAAGFTAHEHWAWARIIRGELADMSCFPEHDEAAQRSGAEGPDDGFGEDPKDAESWPAHRDLSARFLHTILFSEKWANARARPHVRIACARVSEALDWENEALSSLLGMHSCLFRGALNWKGLRAARLLSLSGSRLEAGMDGDGLAVQGALFFREGFSAKGDIRLLGARVGGDVSFVGANLEGALSADRLAIEGALFCREGFSAKGDIRLLGARVGGNVDFTGASLEGALRADGLAVEGALFCSEGFSAKGDIRLLGARVSRTVDFASASLEGALLADRVAVEGDLFCHEGFNAKGDIRLLGARVDGDVSFTGANLEGALSADGLVVAGACFLGDMEKLRAADLLGVRVGGDVQMGRSVIEGRVDLTGAEIKGELQLTQFAGDEPKWGDDAELVLRNAKAGALAGGLDAFRRGDGFVRCDLSGFSYAHIGGLGAGKAGSTLASADGNHLRAWLKRCRADDHFDPAPYRALANALEEAGRKDRAADVRNALGNYELVAKGTPRMQRVMLALSAIFIGYGERNHRALAWFVSLVLLAAVIGYCQDLAWLPQATPSGWADWQAWLDWGGFAFADAIPLVEFDKAHETFLNDRFCFARNATTCVAHAVPTGLTAFFYFVKVAGLVILSYLAAGLSGLAQQKE